MRPDESYAKIVAHNRPILGDVKLSCVKSVLCRSGVFGTFPEFCRAKFTEAEFSDRLFVDRVEAPWAEVVGVLLGI